MTPEEKIAQLEKLLEKDPRDATGFFMLGKLCLDSGRNEQAADAFEKCTELKPDYSAAWRFAGDCYRKAGQDDRARELYERGIAVAQDRGDLQTAREMEAFLRKLKP